MCGATAAWCPSSSPFATAKGSGPGSTSSNGKKDNDTGLTATNSSNNDGTIRKLLGVGAKMPILSQALEPISPHLTESTISHARLIREREGRGFLVIFSRKRVEIEEKNWFLGLNLPPRDFSYC